MVNLVSIVKIVNSVNLTKVVNLGNCVKIIKENLVKIVNSVKLEECDQQKIAILRHQINMFFVFVDA